MTRSTDKISSEAESRRLLVGLRSMIEAVSGGQNRLDQVCRMVAEESDNDVCSVYLLRDDRSLELCATSGLNPEAVHVTRLPAGQGLVGSVIRTMAPISSANAAKERDFVYRPETGESRYSSFLGVPVLRPGVLLGVLVVQSKDSRHYSEDEIAVLEIVAMFLADMTELGLFVGEGSAMAAPHTRPVEFTGIVAQEGLARGQVLLKEPRVVLADPVADDPEIEIAKLDDAIARLRSQVDNLISRADLDVSAEQREVVETYRMFANSRGWVDRIKHHIRGGLSAGASVEMEQLNTRARMSLVADAYLRERLHDLDDLSDRLLRMLAGQEPSQRNNLPDDAILVARQIGPGELLEYGRSLKGIVLEGGSFGSHATIIARAMAIPLLIHVEGISNEALNGDRLLVDGEKGFAYLRPDPAVAEAFGGRFELRKTEQQKYASIRDKSATTRDGVTISLHMNAGVMPHLPNFVNSGAEGVGLFRTELRFLAKREVPLKDALAKDYATVLDSAMGCPVVFRTVDLGSDKLVPYLAPQEEPNPAMGWRAIRIGLDRKIVLEHQATALIKGAKGRELKVMFPMVTEPEEFYMARDIFNNVLERRRKIGVQMPESVQYGAMLETPSLAFAPDEFFSSVSFLSIGGNDLKQFFFAADRENERVRRRYDTLSLAYLNFIEFIVGRCRKFGTRLSYCGETAGLPLEAVCLAASGLRMLSMRSTSIGRVKHMLRRISLEEVRGAIQDARDANQQSARKHVADALGPLLYLNP